MDKQQEQKNKEQLAKFLQIFGADKIVTPDDIKSVLKGVLEIMNSFKKGNETLNKETTSIVESLLNKVMVEHEKMKTEVARETSDTKEEINEKVEKSIQEMKKMCEDLILRKPQDGMDGKDADEEEIVIKVLEQIKLPENKVLTGEDIVDSINALSLEEENKIDASHIKNLPISKGGHSPTVLANAVDLDTTARANGYAIVWDSTNNRFKFAAGGGTIDGTGSAGTLAFWSDADTLTYDAHLTYDAVNDVLHTHKLAGDATDGLIIESANGTDIGILGGANTANVTWYGNHNFDTVTASRVAQFGASKTLESSTVTTTELGYLSGVTSAIQTQLNTKLANVVEDTTPQLGGSLDVNGQKIVSVSNGNIDIEPHGTGNVLLGNFTFDVDQTVGVGQDNYVLTYDNATGLISLEAAAGGGNVTKIGTPVNNQIGVWTGDGTIEGDASLTWDGTSLNIATAKNFQIAGSTILADAAGTTTLSNIDAIDATTEATIEAAIDTLANLTSIQGRTVTLADAGANAIFGWDDTAGAYENLTQAEARTVLGLGTAAYVATDLADLNEATIEGAIDTLANLTSIQGQTFTLAGAFITSGANSLTLTTTGATNVTLPTTGTLATLAGSETLSNKTLTAPKFADLGFIADANGNELIILDTVTSAVNEITLANAATGANPNITASGGDANVGIDVTLKGTGTFNIKGNSTQPGELRLYEDTDLGTNFTAFKVGSQAADISYILPTSQGAASTYLKNDGSGNLSWATAGGGSPGWAFVSYNTGTSTSITVSSLDLSTDLAYKIIVQGSVTDAGTKAFDVGLRINSSSANDYTSVAQRMYYTGGTAGAVNAGQAAANYWLVCSDPGADIYKVHSAEVLLWSASIDGTNTRIFMKSEGASMEQPDGTDEVMHWTASGYNNGQTNVTSITFMSNASTGTPSKAWKVWVFKAATS